MKKKKYYMSFFAFLLSILIFCSSCTSPTNTKPDPSDVNGGTNTGDAVVKKKLGTDKLPEVIDPLKDDK